MPKGIKYAMVRGLEKEHHLKISNKEFDFLCGLNVRQNMTLNQAYRIISLNLRALGKVGSNKPKTSSAKIKRQEE
jgi:hypothetical protein